MINLLRVDCRSLTLLIFNEICLKVQQCVFTINHLWIVINGLLFDTKNICSSANLHSFFSFILALVHLPSTLFRPYSFPPTLSNCSHLSFSLVFPWYCDRKVSDLGCSVLIKPVGKIPRACAENRGATANKQSTQTHSQTLNGPHTHTTTSKGFSHKVYVQNCIFKTLLVFKTDRSNKGMHAKTCDEKVCHG